MKLQSRLVLMTGGTLVFTLFIGTVEAQAQDAPETMVAAKAPQIFAWGTIEEVEGQTGVVRLTIKPLRSFREVVTDLAAFEGRAVLFDKRVLPFIVHEQSVEGTPGELIARLLEPYKSQVVQGENGKTRLFLPGNALLETVRASQSVPWMPYVRGDGFNILPPSVKRKFAPAPDAKRFDFNGQRVYHVPVVPAVKL